MRQATLIGAVWLASLVPFAGSAAQIPAPPTVRGDTLLVTINAIPGFRFDRVRFSVAPGRPVVLTLNNRDGESEMDHNLVITQPGARAEVVAAGLQAPPERNYVPEIPLVVAATPLISEGETFELRFTAPTTPGAYPYVCTFPGHGFIMYGVMYVGQPMPPLARDENVPPEQRQGPETAQGPPPLSTREYPGLSFGTTFPAISRTFLPASGPAAIAVAFDPEHAYNFDAGEIFLASAWKGGFVDNQDHWRGNGNAYGRIEGTVYYRSGVGFPFRLADSDDPPDVAFRGYRLVEGGLPEFHYSMEDVQIHELIRESVGGGLERHFRVTTAQPLRFLTEQGAGVRFEASAGRWSGTTLELTAEQAREFTVTMTPERTSDR